MMKKNEFDLQLSALGVDFLAASQPLDVGKALVKAAGQNELRYWEVFPVLLANAGEQGGLDFASALKKAKATGTEKSFKGLVCMSLGLYNALGRVFPWAEALLRQLGAKSREQVSVLEQAFEKNGKVRVGGKVLSSERVKLAFQRYFKPATDSLSGFLAKKEEFGLEYALSRVFSPKQKELFLKKLKGEKLTKTENEYFSRTVRKKALALANPELHRLASELLK